MKRLLRHSKLVIATMLVALVALTAAGTPAAHAAYFLTSPTIKTSVLFYGSPEGATINVQGSGFTPGGTVLVEEFDSSWHLVTYRTITASPYCHQQGVFVICGGGGAFGMGFEFFSTHTADLLLYRLRLWLRPLEQLVEPVHLA